jgi:hypothetical protein
MNQSSEKNIPFIINNSPIEFIVVGPDDGRDKVLLRSNHAGLDLVGLAAQASKRHAFTPSSSILSLFTGTPRQLNVVESHPVEDFHHQTDSRYSTMRFAWVGDCSSLTKERIEDAFKRSVPDLQRAIQKSTISDIEWSLGAVILECSEAGEKRLRSRRFFYMTLVMYGIAGLLSIAYLIARNLLKF